MLQGGVVFIGLFYSSRRGFRDYLPLGRRRPDEDRAARQSKQRHSTHLVSVRVRVRARVRVRVGFGIRGSVRLRVRVRVGARVRARVRVIAAHHAGTEPRRSSSCAR